MTTITESSLFALWDELYPKVYAYFLRRVDNRLDVEDLTSITLTSFLEKYRRNPDKINNKYAFLWKIAHNQLCLFIKTKSKNFIPISLENEMEEKNIDIEVENYRSSELQKRIEKLIQCVETNLKNPELQIVKRVIMNDEKSVNLSQELNLTPANIRQKLSRSLKKLKTKCQSVWLEIN